MNSLLRRFAGFSVPQRCERLVTCQQHRTVRVHATERNDRGETCSRAVADNAHHAADVAMLEQAYRQAAVPSPEPVQPDQLTGDDHAVSSSSRSSSSGGLSQSHRFSSQQFLPSGASQHQQQRQQQLQRNARALYFSPLLPVFRTLRSTEKKLEAKFPAVGNSIVLMMAVIAYDFGVNNVLDRLLGESPLGSLSCMLVGLGLVLGVRLAGFKVLNFWEV